MQKQELPVSLTRSEISWGIRYLLFELVFLGPLLSIALNFLWPTAKDVHFDFLYFFVNFIAIILIFRKFLKHSIGHTAKQILSALLAAAIGFVLYWVLQIVLSAAILFSVPEFYNVNDAAIAETSREHFLLMAVSTVVLVPIAEEMLHRGLIFGLIHRKSRLAAYAVSTVLFSAIHVVGYIGGYEPHILLLCFLQYVPAGLILAWAYEFSGSIFAPVLIHTAINIIGILSTR